MTIEETIKELWDNIPKVDPEKEPYKSAQEIIDEYDTYSLTCPYCGKEVDAQEDIEPLDDIIGKAVIQYEGTVYYRKCKHCGKIFKHNFYTETEDIWY